MTLSDNNIRAILVDDEPNAIENLSILLEKYCPEITVVSTADCIDNTVIEIKKHNPDVVFLDIEMPEKSGFALFDELEVNFQLIFVTAYDEFAIRAFEVSATDYLLKPIKTERLQKAVQKVSKKNLIAKNIDILKETIDQNEISKIIIPNNLNYNIIELNNVISVEAKGAYSIISFTDQNRLETIIYSKPLRYFDELTKNNKNFIRTHRSWLINKNKIKSFQKSNGIIILEYELEALVSQKRSKEVLKLL